MKKYTMKICRCGRIHMIDDNKINKALDNNKEFLVICAGCGNGIVIGADCEPDIFNNGEEVYNMYTRDLSDYDDAILNKDSFEPDGKSKGFEEILYSHGIKVPMLTGEYANHYIYGQFSDMIYPDFYKIQREGITIEEIMEFIAQYHDNRTTVDMERFINETPNEMLEEISNYWIDAFDWTDTKFDRR